MPSPLGSRRAVVFAAPAARRCYLRALADRARADGKRRRWISMCASERKERERNDARARARPAQFRRAKIRARAREQRNSCCARLSRAARVAPLSEPRTSWNSMPTASRSRASSPSSPSSPPPPSPSPPPPPPLLPPRLPPLGDDPDAAAAISAFLPDDSDASLVASSLRARALQETSARNRGGSDGCDSRAIGARFCAT